MKFAWHEVHDKPWPVKLYEVPVSAATGKQDTSYVQVVNLSIEEERLTLDEVAKKYPYREKPEDA
jgi:hypothetical protein